MGFSALKVYTATMASGADNCSVNLANAYNRVFVQCPTMSTAAERRIWGSQDGTTYYPAVFPIGSGVASPAALLIGSGVTGAVTEIPFIAPYVKIVATAVVSGGGVYRFYCS